MKVLSSVSFDKVIEIASASNNPITARWFSEENLSILETNLPKTAIYHKTYKCFYFITSEFNPNVWSKESCTIRKFDKSGIRLVSEFLEHSNYDNAYRALRAYLSK
jgi:hypothetical protein